MKKPILCLGIFATLISISLASQAQATEDIAVMKINSIFVDFTLSGFHQEIDGTFDPPLDFPLDDYAPYITGPPEFIIYTSGDYGAPVPSGTVDPAAQTIDVDLTSLRLAIDYTENIGPIEYGFNDDISLWGPPMSIISNSYSSDTKSFFLSWTAQRSVNAVIGGLSSSIQVVFTIELSGIVFVSCTAHAGPDQIVFDEVTLDGSQSYDVDGAIISYQWTLIHRTDAANNTATVGQTPIVSNLDHGFYDVTLVVTDDDGLTDTDTMEIAAMGPKGDFDFDGDIDGLDLEEFANNFSIIY